MNEEELKEIMLLLEEAGWQPQAVRYATTSL